MAFMQGDDFSITLEQPLAYGYPIVRVLHRFASVGREALAINANGVSHAVSPS